MFNSMEGILNTGAWRHDTGRITIILDGLTSSGISVNIKSLEGEIDSSARYLVRYSV